MNDLNAFLPQNFVPESEQDETKNFDAIPAGWYETTVMRAELAPTKSGGTMLKVGVRVDGPKYPGVWVWGQLNLHLPNSQKATEIGRRQFASLCVAAGFPKRPPNDAGQLVGKRLGVRVGIKEWQGEKDNEIKAFRKPQGGPPASFQQPSAQAQDYPHTPAQPQGNQSFYQPPQGQPQGYQNQQRRDPWGQSR